MKSELFYLLEHQLIIEIVLDPISIDMMIHIREREIEAGWIRSKTNLLVSINVDSVELSPRDYEQYLKWSVEHLKVLKQSRVAVIANNPKVSALNILLQQKLPANRELKVFSTLRAAATWLNVPRSEITKIAPATKKHDVD